ncbi:lysophospholipid acyltransferase family protein [Amphritea sp. HPY]|uniref:lysophospholipid acyltransferase family protein n=1 Tax=Amphritea sp. HPY TaxID=3421652 RepID=UPI003D7CF410
MKHIKGLLAVSVLFLISLLPLAWAQRLGSALGRKMARGESKLARITRKNVEICFPELDSSQREALAISSIEQTGCSAGEMGMSWMWKPERVLKKIKKVHNEDVLREALARNKGVIAIAPHLGNWEVLGLYLSSKYQMTSMYRPPKLELMDKVIRRKRERMGAKLAPANVKGVRMTMKALKAGNLVGILPDQEADRGSGVFVPFFGIEAYTMKLLPQLAAQTGAEVISAFAKRLPDGEGFEIYFNKADPAIRSKDIEVSARAMNAEVESCVRQIPEQYQWEYRRFDYRPEGEAKVY